MHGNSEPPRVRPSDATTALLMSACRNRLLEAAKQGVDALDHFTKQTSLGSTDVLARFRKAHSAMLSEFLARAGSDSAAFDTALAQTRAPEPQPDPPKKQENPTEDQQKLYELMKKSHDDRRARGEAAAWSRPVKEALRLARQGTTEGVERFGVGAFVAALLTVDSHARAALLETADLERRGQALTWLREQPDPEGEFSLLGDVKQNHRELMDAIWPSIQAKAEVQSEAGRALHEEQYEKDPSRYEEPLDVAKRLAEHRLEPERDYSWRSGVLLHAAANEARIRKAPEATLDHLLLALLRDGTDTADFLDTYGIDRAQWSLRLDAALPRYGEGPRWPPTARDLNMSMPTNIEYRRKAPPEGKTLDDLSKEERRALMERVVKTDLRFTDLRYLANVPDEPKTFAYTMFGEVEVTKDALMAEIVAREKGDRNWWRKRPDFVRQLRSLDPEITFGKYNRAALCVDAAQYEARMRKAPRTEYDDLLMALLVPGTDLWSLLEDQGLDAASVREKLDSLRPRFESGPMFPERADDLNPAGIMTKQGFSDLLFLYARRGRLPDSPGLRLLRKLGLTQEAIDARFALLGVVPL